jgi:hypothetical protein
MRRHWLLPVLLLVALHLIGASASLLIWLSLPPNHNISDEGFARLKPGMSEQEVEDILEVPEGDYRTVPVGSPDGGYGPTDYFGSGAETVKRRYWCGDRRWIQVGFDSQGRVAAAWAGVTETAEEPLLGRIGRLLGWWRPS